MKRGTPDHPKTRALAAKLDLKRWQVVGLLESLWHFTAGYAKRGDIGKWSNIEIASAIEWQGDADTLINSLLQCRWLDSSEAFRLLVHDWQDHADQTVSRSDEVKTLGFASIILDNARQPLLSSPCLALPSHALPSPSPSANGKKLADDQGDQDGDIWKRAKHRANDILEKFHTLKKPRLDQRRRIAVCCYLVERGDFPSRWLDENVVATKERADTDKWGYLWICLRNEAQAMKKNLDSMVAEIDLPETF
jgi:hypothetical protein